MVTWLHCLWACREAEHHSGEVCRAEVFTSRQPESRERKEEGTGTSYTLQGHSPMTYFVQLGHTS